MNKKIASQIVYSLIFLMAMMIMIPQTSAWEWDNVKSISKVETRLYPNITIKNAFGIGGDLAQHYLEDNQCSVIDCWAYGTTALYIDDRIFSNLKAVGLDNMQKNVNIKMYVWNEWTYLEVEPVFERVCALTSFKNATRDYEECTYKEVKSNLINRTAGEWKLYNGEILKAGKYKWKVTGQRTPNEAIDWIPYSMGQELNEWAWWNTTFAKKIPVYINETSGLAYSSNFTALINLTYQTGMETDFKDIRVVNGAEDTELPYWIEKKTDSSFALVWVNLGSVTAYQNQTVYIYYDSDGASTTTANINTTMLFGDEFNVDTLDTAKWSQYASGGSVAIAGGYLKVSIPATTSVYAAIASKAIYSFGVNKSLKFYGNFTSSPSFSFAYHGFNRRASHSTIAVPIASSGFGYPEGSTVGAYNTEASTVSYSAYTFGTSIRDYQIDRWTSNSSFYINSTRIAAITANVPTGLLNVTFDLMNHPGGSSANNIVVDYVFVRNLPLKEPSATLGSVESQTPVTPALNVSTTLVFPPNNTNYTTNSITFSARVNVTSGNLTNATLYYWNPQTLSTVLITGNSSNLTNISVSGLANGIYTWNVLGCASNSTSSICRFGSQNLTINVSVPNAGLFYGTGAYVNNSAHQSTTLTTNISATVPAQFANATVRLYNSSHSLLNSTYHTTLPIFLNYTGLTDGAYYINVSGYSTNSNPDNLGTITLYLDNVAPSVNIVYPINGANYSASNWTGQLNYTASDNLALGTCWYSTNNGATNTTVSCGTNVTGLNPNQYSVINTFLVGINDSAGNIAQNSISFYALTNAPRFNAYSANNTKFTTNTISLISNNTQNSKLTLDCFDSGGGCLAYNVNNSIIAPLNITFNINGTLNNNYCTYSYTSYSCSNSNISTSLTSRINPFTYNATFSNLTRSLPDGTYFWNATITDAFGNSNTSETRIFTIDTVTPVVNVYAPTGFIINLNPGTNLTVNYSIIDQNVNTCWLTYNGVNTTIPCNNNHTILYELGVNNLTVYANDSVGLIGYATTIWSPGIVLGNASYKLFDHETNRSTFSINYSLDNLFSSLAKLNYNGNLYNSNISCTGNVCTATNVIDLPTITGPSQNNSFYWNITAYNGTAVTYKNTTVYQQNVSNITLELCGAGYKTLNFSAYDEQNLTQIITYQFDASFNYYLGSGSTYKVFNYTNTTAINVQLCLDKNFNYHTDAIIAYSAPNSTTSYVTRNYFFQNYHINSTNKNIPLLLLRSSSSTSFILEVTDQYSAPLSGVLVEAIKCYPGLDNSEIAFISRTDSNGLSVGNFESETALYKFNITRDGESLLYLDSCNKVVPQSTPYTLSFQVGTGYTSAFQNIGQASNLTTSIVYNATSKRVTFTFADISNEFTGAILNVRNLNSTGNTNQIVCQQYLNVSTGELTCDLTDAGTYVAEAVVNRNDGNYNDNTTFNIKDIPSIVGLYGVYIGWFIILICAFMFKFNEIAGIWLVNVAILFCDLVGLIDFGVTFITSSILLGIILTVVLER